MSGASPEAANTGASTSAPPGSATQSASHDASPSATSQGASTSAPPGSATPAAPTAAPPTRGPVLYSRRSLTRQLLLASAVLLAAIFLAPLLGVAQQQGQWSVALDSASSWWQPGSTAHYLLWNVRLPRVLAAVLVGAALGTAGAAVQATLRNPLAEPYTLGVSAGATLAAVIAIRLGVDARFGIAGMSFAVLFGALAAMATVLALARAMRSPSPATLVLAGIAITSIASAAALFVQFRGSYADGARIFRWMMGGLADRPLRDIGFAAALIVPCLLALSRFGHAYNAMALGETMARSLGVEVERVTARTFVLASLAVGISVSLAGPIGFVGLLVPHTVRALLGPEQRGVVPLAGFYGATLLLVCDTVARVAFAPEPLPVGVLTALLGGPMFLWILRRELRG